MRPMPLSARLRFMAVSLAATFAVTGCTDWHLYTVEPVRVIEREEPEQVRIYVRAESLSREDRFVMTRPRVVGDSIAGIVKRAPFRVAIAVVTAVAVRRPDWVETALLIAAPPALLFGLACLAACGGY